MSEYTYDIDKYTIGVDENGEDGIGMTVAKIENGELHFLGNCYGENARCIDLLIKENQSLKKENEILKENAENNDKIVDKVNWGNMLLKKENKKQKIQISAREEVCNRLESNWNKLKECIKECLESIDTIQKLTGNAIENYTPRILTYRQILDKMQELQGSDK